MGIQESPSTQMERILAQGTAPVVVSTPATSLPEVYPGPPVPLTWKMCVQLKLENPGITNKELAKSLGVNQQTVGLWVSRYEYQQYEDWCLKKKAPSLSLIAEEKKQEALVLVRDRFESYLEEMQHRLMHILETTDSEKLQVEIIHDTFDRVGFASKKDAPRATPIVVTADAMVEFMRRAREAGIEPELPVLEAQTA